MLFYKNNCRLQIYNLLQISSYGILNCFKCLIFIITCVMQINRNDISKNFYYQIYIKKINFIVLDEF